MFQHDNLKDQLFDINPRFACETVVKEFRARWGRSAAGRFFTFSGMTFYAPDRRGFFSYEYLDKNGTRIQGVGRV